MENKIIIAIEDYVKNYPSLKGTSWRKPVIGFVDAKNPKFPQLKELVGETHAMPEDLLTGAKSVIVFFLPFDEKTINSNIEEIESSYLWDIANIETNNLIEGLNVMLNKLMKEESYDSTLLPATYNYDEKLLRSDWSHRHVAYMAGLGTFGIQNMLITEQGCCGRIGSVVTTMPLQATPPLEKENCLFKYNGSCGICAKRCVAGAMSTENGYPYVNRQVCNKQIYNDCVPEYDIGVGDACGKCMVGLPCSMGNPLRNIE